jgi:hypothetical protein
LRTAKYVAIASAIFAAYQIILPVYAFMPDIREGQFTFLLPLF